MPASTCHCSKEASHELEGLPLCPACFSFLNNHKHLQGTLVPQWKVLRSERGLDQAAEDTGPAQEASGPAAPTYS